MSNLSKIMWICILMMMFASQQLYKYNQEDNKDFDIYNFTQNNNVLTWNYTLHKETIQSNFSDMTGLDYSNIQSKRINNIIHKTIDWAGYTTFEIMKWAMEFGYNHPQYNFKFFMWLMIISVFIPVLVPLIVLFYLIIIGLKKVCLWFKSKSKKPKFAIPTKTFAKVENSRGEKVNPMKSEQNK